MNVFAKFDEIPSMTLQDIKETKRYGYTFVHLFVRSDNVKTVYPPTNTVCGGYKNVPAVLGLYLSFAIIVKIPAIPWTQVLAKMANQD